MHLNQLDLGCHGGRLLLLLHLLRLLRLPVDPTGTEVVVVAGHTGLRSIPVVTAGGYNGACEYVVGSCDRLLNSFRFYQRNQSN